MSIAIKIVSVASLLLTFSCQKNTDNQESQTAIVGGTAPELQHYYAALINKGNPNGIMCGTSFISKRILLTAAHCVDSIQGKLQVRVGMGDDSTQDKLLDVESVIVHKEWNTLDNTNDIAMLKVVDYDASALGVKIVPIKYDENTALFDDNWNKPVRIIGTGKLTSFGELTDPILKQVEIPYIPINDCKNNIEQAGARSSVDERNICAGYTDRGGQTACNGDSGGPLTVDLNSERVLVGLASYVIGGCGQKGFPHVYTRVSKFNAWIKENIKNLDSVVAPAEQGQKISQFQEFNCYDSKFGSKKTIGSGNKSVELTLSFSPELYSKRTASVNNSRILSDAGSCQFSIPTLGNSKTFVINEANQKKFISRVGTSIWEAKVKEKIESTLIRCFDANNTFMAAYVSEGESIANFDNKQYKLRALQMPRHAFTDDMIKTKCAVGDTSMYYYEVLEDGVTYKLMTFQGNNFAKNQEIIYMMKASDSATEAESTTEAEITGTIARTSPNQGKIEIKNTNPEKTEVYTWEISCTKPLEFTDSDGKKYLFKKRVITQNGQSLTLYSYRFEHGNSKHGAILPGEAVNFDVKSTALSLDNMTCDINKVPVKIVIQ